MKTIGSRAEVWHRTADHTSGGLTKQKLFKNKRGRIVSKRLHNTAKRLNRLGKAGYKPTKGTFQLMRKHGSRTHKRRR